MTIKSWNFQTVICNCKHHYRFHFLETIKASDVESSKCDEGIHSKSTSNPEEDTSTKVSSEDMIPMDVDSPNKGGTSPKEAEAKADDVDKYKIKE